MANSIIDNQQDVEDFVKGLTIDYEIVHNGRLILAVDSKEVEFFIRRHFSVSQNIK